MNKTHPLNTSLEHYSITARIVLNLKPPVKRLGLGDLMLYTAAAGSALALAPSAEASIIYSGIKNITVDHPIPPNTIAPGFVETNIDLNNNGKDDIIFGIYNNYNGSQIPTTLSAAQETNRAFLYMGPGDYLSGVTRNTSVNRLDASAADIGGGNTQWAATNGAFRRLLRGYDPRIHPGPYNSIYSIHGAWNPGAKGTITGFAGVKFANNDFGWLHFKLTTDLGFTNSLTLIDWAYQSVPGESIHVGDTGATIPSVPEPSPLSLMALGAAGIAMLRRRRKQEKNADQVH